MIFSLIKHSYKNTLKRENRSHYNDLHVCHNFPSALKVRMCQWFSIYVNFIDVSATFNYRIFALLLFWKVESSCLTIVQLNYTVNRVSSANSI